MSFSQPKISIILPAYRVEQTIARALDSCVLQSIESIEILVVDDCGGDRSIEIARSFARKDRRIQIIKNPKNYGLLRSRYEGARRARGEYLIFLDCDDYLDLQVCERCLEVLQKFKVDFIHLNLLVQKRNLEFYGGGGEISQLFSQEAYMKKIIQMGHCPWNLCGKCIHTQRYLQVFEQVDMTRRIDFGEDALIYFHLLASSLSIYMMQIKGAAYYYCFNPVSMTRDKDCSKLSQYIANEAYILKILEERFLNLSNKNMREFYVLMHLDLLIYQRSKIYTLQLLDIKAKSGFLRLCLQKCIYRLVWCFLKFKRSFLRYRFSKLLPIR